MALDFAFFQVILYSLVANAVSEAAMWGLVWRTQQFKTASNMVERAKSQLEKFKGKADPSKKNNKRQLQVLENEVSRVGRIVSGISLRGTVASAAVMILAFSQLNSYFGGMILGKLPFTPFGFLQGLTHRGLDEVSKDPRDLSATFVYVLATTVFRYVFSVVIPKPAALETPSIWEQATKMAESMEAAASGGK
ncbi:hypothetical protein AMAG_04747 [Allomyces macrogynus ATCC 38327]|uniref:Uncharacterized protein n=1 Tax=Allomyces macrogynus (strain ATCC 38327) TaxID=578462 RepID=A0A0L0S6B6_ALLM3|nr:hypothetical protein AMAG_04747 [Allomyces macrogynus ATCC 38327]|eukprot:KNE57904.1 hypothetical protein AMAG_04747 [Allomyces macrogynus ATCC 38327]